MPALVEEVRVGDFSGPDAVGGSSEIDDGPAGEFVVVDAGSVVVDGLVVEVDSATGDCFVVKLVIGEPPLSRLAESINGHTTKRTTATRLAKTIRTRGRSTTLAHDGSNASRNSVIAGRREGTPLLPNSIRSLTSGGIVPCSGRTRCQK